MYIFFNEKELLNVSENLDQIKISLNDELRRIQRLFQELDGDWQSEAQRAMVAKIICVSKHYDKLIELCNNLSEIIFSYVNSITEIDSAESSYIKNLAGGN